MLEFGIEKIIWIFSKIQKVFTFTTNNEPIVLAWSATIEVVDGISFNIADFLKEEGVEVSAD